jgi:hypothetical protein
MKNQVKNLYFSRLLIDVMGETGVFWDTGSRGTVRGKIENVN